MQLTQSRKTRTEGVVVSWYIYGEAMWVQRVGAY